CLALGLANRLTKEGETLNEAKALARAIAKRPPIATRLIIEAVDEGLDASIDRAIDVEVRAFLKSLKTEDASEGIQAFFAKRESVQIQDVVSRVERDLGPVDICVNNAGLIYTVAQLKDMKDEDWELNLAVNVTGTYKVTKAVFPGMRERRWGRIVCMGRSPA